MSLRERINSDRKLQLGLGVVLLLVVVLFMMKKGGGESAAISEAAAPASIETAAEPAAGTEGAEGEASLAALGQSVKAAPLPHKLTAAYRANKTVAVLFVHNGGTDDELVKLYSKVLHHFVPKIRTRLHYKLIVVPVKHIGRYTALTLGMQVQRVPALVILRRKSLSKAGPEASILYGYQAPDRILLAIRNASYDGPSGSYHPG